ncbi:MAG: PepSY domain-containing protein [Gammaproteobacteria bacterium]|nr:PepSY domain-containing protein [Gammaproteobacteria bacterium]
MMKGHNVYLLRGALLAGTVATAIVLMTATAPASDDHGDRARRDDHHAARELVRNGRILPLRQVLGMAEGHQAGRVLEAEFEKDDGRYIYEIEIVDDNGIVWELEMDAMDGNLLKREH